jgi:aspartate aminotransferase
MSTSLREHRCRTYRAPQERVDAILGRAWRKFGPRMLDLAYPNSYDGPEPHVINALQSALASDRALSLQYTPYGGATTARRLVAGQLSRRFGLEMNYRDVVLTPGAMAALNVTFRTLFDSEGEVILLTPCWLDYPLYLTNLGIPFQLVPLTAEKRLDLEAITKAIGPQTSGILFSHPGCPTGVVLSSEELEGLAKIISDAERRYASKIFLISDEVHRDLVWGSATFRSALGTHPRSLVIYSFGKMLLMQGQRMGYVAVSPHMPERHQIRERLVESVRMMGFCAPTSLMQRALPGFLDYTPPLADLGERQRIVRAALHDSGYEVCDAAATFFIYVRCPMSDDFTFTECLADHGVAVLPSSLFHEPGYFRISVTARRETLLAALPVLSKVR